MERCAPNLKYTDNSCFSLESLLLIATQYNKINYNKINITNNKIDLIEQLTNVFSKSCNNQICWLKLDLVKNLNNTIINQNTFRPEGPDKKYDWLNTNHINDVVNQYHLLYNDFVFLGAVPNDFEDFPILGLTNIDFNTFIKNKKTKLGLVINLDNHDQSGSHWVGLYIDLLNYYIYYFDSAGKPPGKRIKKFNNKIINYMYYNKYNIDIKVEKIISILKQLNDEQPIKYFNNLFKNKLINFDIRHNTIQHQFDNSECGVYSINFILRLAKGETFDSITENITKDDEMNKCRKTYFR